MNVVSLSTCYPSPGRQHVGTFVRSRLRAVSETEHVRVVQVVPTPVWRTRPMLQVHREEHPPVWRVPMRYIPGADGPWNPILYARAALPVIRPWAERGAIDVLDAHFIWPDGVAAAHLATATGLPFVITLRGVLPRCSRQWLKRGPIVRALRQASSLVAVSESLKAAAVRLGADSAKIQIIPNGIEAGVFRPGNRSVARAALGRAKEETILVTVGHLCPRKGVQHVLAILPGLVRRMPTVRYVVIGDDGAERPYRSVLGRLARRAGLDRVVTFTGALPADKVAQWLQAADLFVLPSRNEGCCNALCEAAAVEVPIVCTDVGGNRDLVAGRRAHFVPVGDHAQLARACVAMIENPVRGDALGRTARTWMDVGRETSAVLRAAASGKFSAVRTAPFRGFRSAIAVPEGAVP